MAITTNPKLKIDDTGEERTLYFDEDSKNEGARDDTADHNIAGRDGDISQDMGRGSRRVEGDVYITSSMDSNGIDGYEQFLLDAARTESKLTYTEDDGSTTWKAELEEPEFDKSPGITPNMIKASVVIKELDEPTDSP